MELFVKGKLNPQCFETDLRQGTHDLSDVLLAAATTQSEQVESTHFLMVLGRIVHGVTQKHLVQLGLDSERWQSVLGDCVQLVPDALPPAHLTESVLHPSARGMLREAEEFCAEYSLPRISEATLLLAALKNMTPAVEAQFKAADIVDLDDLRAKVKREIEPPVSVSVFNQDGKVNLESFSPGGRKVLRLLCSEAEALGYTTADPRHLLLALLARENGALKYGLHHQGVLPRKVQEAVMFSLGNRAKRNRSVVPLARQSLQPILQKILEFAGQLAGQLQINEPALLRAFLATESAALRILLDEKVQLADLRACADDYTVTLEEEAAEDSMTDIKTVEARLKRRLVGQDDAIKRILPYVQRMRFGFTTPGRPVGVFLFCGQSGSGKTEMAKELARAVYGSEENLIFLEMGQFNAPESMNIFVGAPPGYVGYGEGKLTNGLRDKPRAVVLFDEVEKAHARVLDALLRFLDEGKIDDPAGPVRDGSQCILILTSNVGAERLSKFSEQIKENDPHWRTKVRDELRAEFMKKDFRLEFLNRVDEIILFHTLTVDDYAYIAQRLLNRDLERLDKERQIEVVLGGKPLGPVEAKGDAEKVSPVAQAIGAYCYTLNEGARTAQRLTQSVVITPVIDFVLQKNCTPPVRLRVHAELTAGSADGEPVGIVDFAG